MSVDKLFQSVAAAAVKVLPPYVMVLIFGFSSNLSLLLRSDLPGFRVIIASDRYAGARLFKILYVISKILYEIL